MKNNILGFVLLTELLAFGFAVEAQQTAKIPRIGYLTGSALSVIRDRSGAFRDGLREFGYVDGKTILIEWKSAEGKLDLLPRLAEELVGLKVNIIVTTGALPTRAAKTATTAIPIVMAQDIDPVGSGFVASLARPGGNVTGLSSLSVDISGKRLEILKEIVPKLSQVALLGTSTIPGFAQSLKEVELAAAALGVRVKTQDIVAASYIEPALRAAVKERADAILVLQSFVLNSQRKKIIELAAKNRLPGIYYAPEWVEDGGLISYGVSFSDMNRRVASYVDKILKGARPGELPVEQATKFDLVINLKAAKLIGLTVPPHVLARADRIIK